MKIDDINIYSMSLSEKKIISIFKSFIEKIFVPELPKMEASSQNQWKKFLSMISRDHLNTEELQSYVNSLPLTFQRNSPKKTHMPQISEVTDKTDSKSPVGFQNSIKEINHETGFANKTFGGERARLMLMQQFKNNEDLDRNQTFGLKKETVKQSYKDEVKSNAVTTQTLIPSLQRLFKLMEDNHLKITKDTKLNRNSYSIPSNYDRNSYQK